MSTSYSFFAYVSRMKLIERWALMRSAQRENIAEHCMLTASLAHVLGLIHNDMYPDKVDTDRMAVCSLYHDLSEVLTGDMPTPLKYNNVAIREAYKQVEAAANEKLVTLLPPSLQGEFREILCLDPGTTEAKLIKAADTLSAYIKCIEECAMGNTDFADAKDATLVKLNSMHLAEVDFFLASFIKPIGMPVDSL